MRISRLMIGMTGLGALAAAALAAQGPRTFAYDPVPRWTEEPETEEVCKAIAAECGTKFPTGEIDANWGYAEHYDADGYLVGLKTTVSTGCKPLDEHMLLGHRRFRGAFSKDGQPELEGIAVELKTGTPKDAVRLIKKGETQVGMGC